MLPQKEEQTKEAIWHLNAHVLRAVRHSDRLSNAQVEHGTFYDQNGQPSRFMELSYYGYKPKFSVRVAVQRNDRAPRWTLYWTIYVNGIAADEGESKHKDLLGMQKHLDELMPLWEEAHEIINLH